LFRSGHDGHRDRWRGRAHRRRHPGRGTRRRRRRAPERAVNSYGLADTHEDTGPIGPVALSALLALLVLSPLMRGGNRHVALIVLEAVALAFLAAMAAGAGR